MSAFRVILIVLLCWCGTHKAFAAADPAGAREFPGAHSPTLAAVAGEHEAIAQGAQAANPDLDEENVSFSDINWYYGFVGERDGVGPGLLWRPTGMPAPFLATLVNWLALMALIVVFAKKQLPAALKKRKASIVQGMDEAGRIKAQAEARLNELEEKLSHVDEEIERIVAEMQHAGQLDRERILREAEERRSRMQRDAARLIETELEGAKEQLRREVVQAALEQASQEVSRQMTGQDQQRLVEEALGSLKNLPSNSLGGRA